MYLLKRLFWHLKHEENLPRWAVSRFLLYTGIGRIFTVDCGLYKIRFFPSSVSAMKWLAPLSGIDDELFLRSILKPDDTVIDVGANIGTMSLPSAVLVGKQGLVVAFEPNMRTFNFLKKNISLNRLANVRSHNCAVGDTQGEVYFSDLRNDDYNKIVSHGDKKIPMTTLDEQVSSIPGRIKLLKVDVEGYEKFVFMGGKKTLERTDYLYFEVFEPHFNTLGYTTSELLNMLKESGFSFYLIGERGKEEAIDTNFIPEKCLNILGKREGLHSVMSLEESESCAR